MEQILDAHSRGRAAPLAMMKPLDGLLLIDKPESLTSARVVAQVKRLLPPGTKVGHAGTLDQFATGLLLLMLGRATRQCESLMNHGKSYESTVKLGAKTASDDPDSPEEAVCGAESVKIEDVEAALSGFVGTILQRPPAYSALKLGGRRASDRLRDGEQPVLEPRTVHVEAIRVLDYQWPLLRLHIDCGRGTYVRAIARDLGQRLGVGGYLVQLRRTRVGPYRVKDAVRPELLDMNGIAGRLIRLDSSGERIP